LKTVLYETFDVPFIKSGTILELPIIFNYVINCEIMAYFPKSYLNTCGYLIRLKPSDKIICDRTIYIVQTPKWFMNINPHVEKNIDSAFYSLLMKYDIEYDIPIFGEICPCCKNLILGKKDLIQKI